MNCNFRKFAFLISFLTLISAQAEENGEAKQSRLNAMKKVEDGNPILKSNMMNHIMQAQMYRSQMNFAKAAEEDMKAQMLKQQIDQNDNSKDENKKQKEDVIYTSDAAQKQMRMEASLPSMQAGSGRPEATATSQSNWAPKQEELLNFDEQVDKQYSPAASKKTVEIVPAVQIEAPAATAVESTPAVAPADNGNKVLSPGLMQAFQQIESDYHAQQPGTEPVAAKYETPVTENIVPAGLPAEAVLTKVQFTDELKKLNAKKEKERESFWKSKKPAKKKATGRAAKRRQEAKKKPKELKKANLGPLAIGNVESGH